MAISSRPVRWLLLSGVVLCASHGAGQIPTTPNVERALDDLVARFPKDRVPGMSLTVVEDGRVIYAKGFGSTSLEKPNPPTADTQYRIASVSKPFTAAAVFQLVHDGKVKLDEPARTYCRELVPLNGAPTVRHFLTHQSGMRHTTDSEDTTTKGPVRRLGDALGSVVREPLRFSPGTKTLYTSWGYAALGCVIESVSGQSYSDFLKERVLATAGLTATTFDFPEYAAPQFSPGFRSGRLYGFRPSEVVDTRFKLPASGIISTTNDLVRFATAIYDGKLGADLVKEMFSEMPDGEGRIIFTPGWVAKGKQPYGSAFDYNGSMEGVTAFLDVVPDRRYALALLSNRERYVSELQPIVNEARRIVLERSSR